MLNTINFECLTNYLEFSRVQNLMLKITLNIDAQYTRTKCRLHTRKILSTTDVEQATKIVFPPSKPKL